MGGEAAPEIIPGAGACGGAAGRHLAPRSPAAGPPPASAASESPPAEVNSSCLFVSPFVLLPPFLSFFFSLLCFPSR